MGAVPTGSSGGRCPCLPAYVKFTGAEAPKGGPTAGMSFVLPILSPDPSLAGERTLRSRLRAKPAIATFTPKAMVDRTRAAVDEMDGRWLLLGPDCSTNPDTRDDLLYAARAALGSR